MLSEAGARTVRVFAANFYTITTQKKYNILKMHL